MSARMVCVGGWRARGVQGRGVAMVETVRPCEAWNGHDYGSMRPRSIWQGAHYAGAQGTAARH